MSITPEQNVVEWEKIVALSMRGAAPTATAMAKHIAERAQKVTLRRHKHGSGAWHRARPGEPPSTATGRLGKSMYYIPASSRGLRTSAWVGNDAEYSRIMEFGCVVSALNKEQMHWKDSGSPIVGWFHRRLENPAHPFLSPTTEEAIDDGSLFEAARDEFRKYDP